ncbi:MAG: helix-turn-helix transcriptional regulator [Pseudomonadota bacterium]
MTDQIHNRVAMLRTERGLSRKALSEALGINYQTVGYIERGDYNPSLDLALRMAAFFELPVEMIFSLTPLANLSQQVAALKARDKE